MDDIWLVVGVVSSVIMLGALIYLQKHSPNILKVPAQWVAVAALPIVVVLFAGGYITKFSGFGIMLESTLNAPISATTKLIDNSIISDIRGNEKESVTALRNLSRQQKLETRYLRFVSGRSVYLDVAVAEYLASLPNLYFLEVVDATGKFICILPIETFVTDGAQNAFDNAKIASFVAALARDEVPFVFAQSANTTSLISSTDLVSVLKTMRNEQIKYIGIVSPNGQYLGAAIKSDIEHKIADSVLLERRP